MEKRISISCAALAQIKIGDKYLLMMNKGKFGPIGGALKYYDNTIPFLESLDYKPERDGEDFYDLRISIPEEKWDYFKKWFSMFTWRETTVHREVIEELQPFMEKDINELKEKFLRIVEFTKHFQNDNKAGTFYKNRIFQIHSVEVPPNTVDDLIKSIEKSEDLILVTKDQILNKENNISGHSKHII